MSDALQHDSGRFKSIYFLFLPAGIVILALAAIMAGRRHPQPMSMPPQAVVLAETQARNIIETWEYAAQLEADRIVDLKARVSGFLIHKNFTAGDQVKKDQLLFQIEPDNYQALLDMAQAEVLSARAQFDRATLDFNRINDLYKKNTSTKSDFDSSKAAFEVASAQLKSALARETQARLNLDYASIKAPFDGRISDTPYSEGSLLGPESGVLATLVATDPVLAVFGLPSRTAAELFQRDESAAWYADDWLARLKPAPEVLYPGAGRLVYLSPTVDAQTDTVKIKARFDNPDDVLRPGQIATAVLEGAQPRHRLLVPKAAVLTDPQGRYVLTVREAPEGGGLVAERRPVVLDQGELDREYFIREGLEAGDKFIVQGLMSGGATLRPGAPVRLAPPEGGPGPAGGGGG